MHTHDAPGILSIDINSNDDTLIVTGGIDGFVKVYNYDDDRTVATFKHDSKITHVQYHPHGTHVMSAADECIRIWNIERYVIFHVYTTIDKLSQSRTVIFGCHGDRFLSNVFCSCTTMFIIICLINFQWKQPSTE